MSFCTPIVNDTPYIQWIYSLSGDCVYGWQECVSLLLGYLSIFCWLNAQMPQVIKNYRLGQAESLSFSFLTVWLIGDVANFIGCIATHQLPFQLYLSIYFIIIDSILCLQFLYYVKYPNNSLRQWITYKEGKVNEHTRLLAASLPLEEAKNENKMVNTKTAAAAAATTTILVVVGLFTFYYSTLTSQSSLTTISATTTEEIVINNNTDMIWVGRFIAWLCTFLYLASRLPQIIKNFQHRSVEGLSMALFFFAACGNMTYVLSIFTNPHATRKAILEAIPYLLGSAGTLCFDATIFGQYLVFHQRSSYNDHSTINVV